jgi:hypothetical protein
VDVAMIAEELVQRWEAAYRRYGAASKSAAAAVPGDRVAAQGMAAASREVADVWREMESASDLPWWLLAALSAAGQAFEFQARDWNARAEHAWPADERARPQVRLTTKPRPRPRPSSSGGARGERHG